VLLKLFVAVLCAWWTSAAAASLGKQRECRRQALAWHLLVPFDFGFVSLSLVAPLFIVVLLFIISKVKTNLARNGALPQPGTAKCCCRLYWFLWSPGWTHPPASINAPRLCMFAAPRRLHERIQDERID
jgi:hypothetical protein